MKLIYKILSIFLFIFLTLIISNCRMVYYGIKQGVGQIRLIRNARPISEMMNDSSVSDSLKQKLLLIEGIKQYAYDSLGLNPSKNYNTFYDQKGKPIVWIVIACNAYKMEAYEWKFPVVGKLPYKGFFKKEEAIDEADKLSKKGFDTRISTVSAWSTLGYFKDPILSEMLNQSEGQIARLIIHELTHSTLFIKGNAQFNENLATFVGDEGAIYYLRSKYGQNSPELKKYIDENKDEEAFSNHIVRGAKKLDSLFMHFDNTLTDSLKKEKKYSLIKQIISQIDTISFSEPQTFNRIKNKLPNNAFFIGYITYNKDQGEFWNDFKNKFNSDFKLYLAYLKKRYQSD